MNYELRIKSVGVAYWLFMASESAGWQTRYGVISIPKDFLRDNYKTASRTCLGLGIASPSKLGFAMTSGRGGDCHPCGITSLCSDSTPIQSYLFKGQAPSEICSLWSHFTGQAGRATNKFTSSPISTGRDLRERDAFLY